MDAQKFNIRTYNGSDKEEVIGLWEQCKLVVPWNHPEMDIDIKVNFQPELFLVGQIDDVLVATVMAGFEGHRGWINYLAVRPGFQKRGIGQAIMQEAERRLRDLGCPKINLQVRSSNKDVIAFYESVGFTRDDVVSMGKRLDGREKD